MVKYVGTLMVYNIIDLHNYLLMTLDRKISKVYLSMKELSQLSLGQVRAILLVLHT